MSKRVVITGGAGFIGSHTAEEFINNGYEVVVIDNLRTGSLDNLINLQKEGLPFTFVQTDICDIKNLSNVFKERDIVVHLAALVSIPETIANPVEAHNINVTGAHDVFIAGKNAGVRMVVSASSAAIYGNNAQTPTIESSSYNPMSPYALHKCINEQYGKLYSETYGLPSTFLRFFNVYGPRQKAEGGYASVIPLFIKKVKNNEVITINGSESISRDFIFVKDVARAIRLAAEADIKNASNFNVINVGTGVPTTLCALWNTLSRVTGTDIKPIYGPKREGDIEMSLANVEKAKNEIGFTAETSFEDGLRQTIG